MGTRRAPIAVGAISARRVCFRLLQSAALKRCGPSLLHILGGTQRL
jgi:hypothetical protein